MDDKLRAAGEQCRRKGQGGGCGFESSLAQTGKMGALGPGGDQANSVDSK